MTFQIPPLSRGRAHCASSAEWPPRRTTFYRHSARQSFCSPLPAISRVAVIARLFEETVGVQCFGPESLPEVESFQPRILAASVQTLLHFAPVVQKLWAVVPFSGARLGEITARDRDLLWSAFHAPVFEQRLGMDGTVIARECEAHDGLHVAVSRFFKGSLRTDPCECGRSEPRI